MNGGDEKCIQKVWLENVKEVSDCLEDLSSDGTILNWISNRVNVYGMGCNRAQERDWCWDLVNTGMVIQIL
jgi:hypothetical protein